MMWNRVPHVSLPVEIATVGGVRVLDARHADELALFLLRYQ